MRAASSQFTPPSSTHSAPFSNTSDPTGTLPDCTAVSPLMLTFPSPSVVLTMRMSVPVAVSTRKALEVEVAIKNGEAEITCPMPEADRVKS